MNTQTINGITVHTDLFIDGEFVPASNGKRFEVVNPSTGEVIAQVSGAQAADVDRAARAARRQYETGEWSRMHGSQRGRLLHRLADLIERDKELLARLESVDNGKLYGFALGFDIANLIDTVRYFAGWADKLDGRTVATQPAFGRPTFAYTVREPLGVIGAMGAYNAPSMYIGWKCAPALAAGNTVVYKPAEEAPLTTHYIAGLFQEAGFPGGVFNVVSGLGPIVGPAIVEHPEIDKVSFTGGGAIGRTLASQAAQLLKPITLELGGKAPAIVLEDANLNDVLPTLGLGIFANQGQICAAGTRILVQKKVQRDVVEGLAEIAKQHKLGNALDPESTMGPLTTRRAVDRVLNYIESGKREGAILAAGGSQGSLGGQFVEPTVFSGTNSMKVAQEEIFGPIGIVIPFETPEEAVAIANDTQFGLSAGLFTRDLSAAHQVARRLRVGTVWINGFGLIDARLPWGGVKASGYGRENGVNGLEDVTIEKVVSALL